MISFFEGKNAVWMSVAKNLNFKTVIIASEKVGTLRASDSISSKNYIPIDERLLYKRLNECFFPFLRSGR